MNNDFAFIQTELHWIFRRSMVFGKEFYKMCPTMEFASNWFLCNRVLLCCGGQQLRWRKYFHSLHSSAFKAKKVQHWELLWFVSSLWFLQKPSGLLFLTNTHNFCQMAVPMGSDNKTTTQIETKYPFVPSAQFNYIKKFRRIWGLNWHSNVILGRYPFSVTEDSWFWTCLFHPFSRKCRLIWISSFGKMSWVKGEEYLAR